MNYKLVYYDEVHHDIKEAKRWYNKINTDLSKRFSIAIKEAILKLQELPTIHAIRYKNVRIVYPKTFPYAIHYYLDDSAKYIVVIAIIHTSREQEFIRNRR